MATQTPPSITIAKDGDLIIRLYKTDETLPIFTLATGRRVNGECLASFKVSRAALIKESAVFKVELRGYFAEAKSAIVDVEEGTVKSLELWFRIIHNAMTEAMYKIPIVEIWEAVAVADFRDFPETMLNGWFAKWLEQNKYMSLDEEDMRQLLYPCRLLNYRGGSPVLPHAFAFMTKTLAYEAVEHITEINPTHHRHLHLMGNEIGSINGAKGSLRTKLLRCVFGPIGNFLHHKCSCKEKALFAYVLGISKTGIWPMETQHQKSIREILFSPGFIDFECKVAPGTCAACIHKCDPYKVEETRVKLLSDFHGLCLDCMELSRSKINENVDEDYWLHDEHRSWDRGCRISHGQPTWYFSFMGRRAEMKAHQIKKNEGFQMRRAEHESKCCGHCSMEWCRK